MKKIYQLFFVVVMLGAAPMFTSCSEWFEEYDNPVPPAIAAISITADGISGSETILNKGDKLQLKVVITPENTNETSVTWTSTDEAVATVQSNGLVTATGPGTALITVTSNVNGAIFASFTVSVNDNPVPPAIAAISITADGISGSETVLDKGDKLQLKVVITPENTNETSVTWTSTDEAVATVQSNGLVTATGPGTALITVTSNVNGAIFASFTVSVNDNITLDDDDKVDQSKAQSR